MNGIFGDFSENTRRIWWPFRNDAEEEIPSFAILRITGTVVVDDERYLKAAKPNTFGSQYMHYVNGPHTIPSGGYGECTIVGAVAAYYATGDGTPAFGESWGPRSGVWTLKKNTGGFRVLGTVDTTNGIVLVTQDPFLDFRGVADADIAADATGTVSIYIRTGASTYTDTTVNVSAHNDLDDTVSETAMVRCRWEGWMNSTTFTEGWVIYQSDCP